VTPRGSYVYARFAKVARKIDYLLIDPEKRDLAAIYFPTFSRPWERLDVAYGDRMFEAAYSMLCWE
jgi:hypothetical protein